jgi:predicted ribonuclease YlaK
MAILTTGLLVILALVVVGVLYVIGAYNGLVHVVNRFRGEKIAGHITMNKGERSQLAEIATNLL